MAPPTDFGGVAPVRGHNGIFTTEIVGRSHRFRRGCRVVTLHPTGPSFCTDPLVTLASILTFPRRSNLFLT